MHLNDFCYCFPEGTTVQKVKCTGVYVDESRLVENP